MGSPEIRKTIKNVNIEKSFSKVLVVEPINYFTRRWKQMRGRVRRYNINGITYLRKIPRSRGEPTSPQLPPRSFKQNPR